MSEHTPLTEAERGVVLEPCECGHTLNDHGDLGGCWVCNDGNERECWVTCEALMLDRIARLVAARTSTATADHGQKSRDLWAHVHTRTGDPEAARDVVQKVIDLGWRPVVGWGDLWTKKTETEETP